MTYSTLKTTTLLALICCGSAAYASPKFNNPGLSESQTSGPTLSKRPLSANEFRCGKRVQGRVAWNRSGATSWQPKNVSNLCAGVTNIDRRIGCFKQGIKDHNSWQQAIAECKVSAKSLEKSCHDDVQDKVAWNTNGAKRWNPKNIHKLCNGVAPNGHHKASRRISCFKEDMPRSGWKRAIENCTKDALL